MVPAAKGVTFAACRHGERAARYARGMAAPLLSLVVAMSEDNVIGRDNALPWHLPADLKRFKALTMGKPIVMGRKTYESIGRPLPGRTNIVVSRSARQPNPDIAWAGSLDEAIERAGEVPEIAVIGGEEIFRSALPRAARIYLTRVHAHLKGDARFPGFDPAQWHELDRFEHPADERHAFAMTFTTLERVAASARR
jgi:dihydrofolate reductase